MLTKGDICKILEGKGALQKGKYDTALPRPWAEDFRHLGIDVYGSYIWDYSEDRIFGKPLNISELFIKHFSDQIQDSIEDMKDA